MFSVLVIRLRSLRLLRVSGIVMRLRMFLLLITFLKARSEERFSRNAETDLVCRLLLEKKKNIRTKTVERFAICLAFVENRLPSETDFRAFEYQKFKQLSI